MEPGRNNIDPGWNDPPIFSYTETKDLVKSPKRTLLNKRVAYPLSGVIDPKFDKSTIAGSHSNVNLPPLSTATPPNVCQRGLPFQTVTKSKEDQPRDVFENVTCTRINPIQNESMLSEILSNVNQVIEDKTLLLQSQNKYEQVKKKIHVLQEAWRSKLTDDIKERVLKLSTAMKEQKKNEANEIQASLMVDYPKLCCEFIPAFRMLINLE